MSSPLRLPLRLPERINLREVGLRDGLQIETPIPTSAKLELLDALVGAGLTRIEATAFVSPTAVPAMADAEQVAAALHRYAGVEFSALVLSPNGARRAVAAGIHSLEYVISASEGHSIANARRTTQEALDALSAVSDIVHAVGGTCEVIIATAWDCPFDGPTSAKRVGALTRGAVERGADRLCLGDTIGTVTPLRMSRLVDTVRDGDPAVPLGIHIHNTRGAALATIFAAMQLGVTDIDASIGGLGGCPFAPGASGNVATEELAYMCRDMEVETGADLGRLIDAARLAQTMLGHRLDSGLLRAGDRRRSPGSSDREPDN